MEAAKVGVLVTALIVLVGVGMYFMDDYTGALVTSGGYKCEETENLFTGSSNDLEAKQSIFKKGATKTKVGSASWSRGIAETCSGNVLTERYCLSDGTATSEAVTCDNGCSNGKCNLRNDCTDSDGGEYYFTPGETTEYPGEFGSLSNPYLLGVPPYGQSPSSTKRDSCSGNTLTEYYCDGVNIESTTIDCNSLDTASVDYECDWDECVGEEILCDGIDNDNDGIVDKWCDNDNDDYCRSFNRIRASPYSCSGSNNCCPLGGGDCDDGNSNANPGIDEEDCIGNGDENCDGVADEDAGCTYTCVESGSIIDENIVGVYVTYPYIVTVTASDGGLVTYYNPSCSAPSIVYRSCVSGNSKAIDYYIKSDSCSATGCNDPDGPNGPEPAACSISGQEEPIDFDEAVPPIFKKYPY